MYFMGHYPYTYKPIKSSQENRKEEKERKKQEKLFQRPHDFSMPIYHMERIIV